METMTKPFTKYQKDEILPLIHNRQETVQEDIESADEFEATPGALDELERKIKADDMNFTEAEKAWLIEEIEFRMEIASEADEPYQAAAFLKSLQNAIDKINS